MWTDDGEDCGLVLKSMLPEDFAYVRDIIPDAFEDIRYAGSHNFMGRPACGYGAARAVLTLPAALALKKAAAGIFRLKGAASADLRRVSSAARGG